MTKARFMEKLTPEEYLDTTLKGLDEKEREEALKGIEWTPRRLNDNVAIVIEIKKGQSLEIWGVVTGSMRKFK